MQKMKFFFFLFIFFLSIFSSYSQFFKSRDLHFNLEPVISYSHGKLGEVFYYPSSADSSKKISFLEWDRQLFLFGTNINLTYKKLHLDFGFLSSFFDQKSGEMRDSDYLNQNDYSMKTCYSFGENRGVKNYEFHISSSYDFNAGSCFIFSPTISFQYMYDSFERESGEGWYSSDNEHSWDDESSIHYPRTYWNGQRYVTQRLAEIDIYRHSFFTWLGFNTKIKVHRRLNFDVKFLLSPFTYFYAVDSHYAQDKNTKEIYQRHYRMIQESLFNLLKLSAGINFILNDNFEICLVNSYFFTFEMLRGTLYSDFIGGDRQDSYYNTGQDSGANVENYTLSLSCKIKIL